MRRLEATRAISHNWSTTRSCCHGCIRSGGAALATCADFISRKFAQALSLMQLSMLAVTNGHIGEGSRKGTTVALICFRLIAEADVGHKGEDGSGKLDLSQVPEERKAELCGIAERGLNEALRLDPQLSSAYIDAEMLAQIRHPDDAHVRVALRKLVEPRSDG